MTCAPAVARPATRHARGTRSTRSTRRARSAIPVIAALAIALAATFTAAEPAQAAYAPRVVIVVGPTHGATRGYLGHARDYARQARAYGAHVQTVFHPHATWARVVAAAQGANVLIYLGHGNGWPSPYAPYQGRTKNGLGLNPRDGASASQVKYYGEDVIRAHLRLAPGAVVLLNRLCYASGNGEPGAGNPSWSTAVKRVDNFASGFIDAGASVVLADGHTSLAYEIPSLLGPGKPVLDAWRSDPDANGHVRAFPSRRSPGYTVRLDPDRPGGGFYRSLVTRDGTMTSGVRTPAFWGTAETGLALRSRPDAKSRVVRSLAAGSRYVVVDRLVSDDRGRTWAPVQTRHGDRGYVAAWATDHSGSARTRTRVVLRAGHSVSARRLGLVRDGARVTVLRSARDRHDRAWLRVVTPGGRGGWIAAWLARP